MSVKKPPVDVDALISKGAPVKADKDENTYINLRIPTDMLKEIDLKVRGRRGLSRTGWILEAIQRSDLW